MKYIRQFLIILAISFIGELLKYVLPLPIPASIYGMAILFVCLMTGWIKLEAVKETGKFLIEIMPLMFIPAGVGLMVSWGNAEAGADSGMCDHGRYDHYGYGDDRQTVTVDHQKG